MKLWRKLHCVLAAFVAVLLAVVTAASASADAVAHDPRSVIVGATATPTTEFARATHNYNVARHCLDSTLGGRLGDAQVRMTTERPSISASGGVSASPVGFVAAKSADTVVLGHYPEYVDLAKATGGRTFQIPTKVWDSMSPTEQWAANQKFLDRAIARGSNIRLATPANAAREGSYFERELQYMQSRGYTVGPNGMSLIAPGGP